MKDIRVEEKMSREETIKEMRITILYKKGKSRYVIRILNIEDGGSHCFPFITEMQDIADGKEFLRISWGVDSLEEAQERFESAVMRLYKRANE